MKSAPVIFLATLMIASAAPAATEELILHLRPESTAPVVTHITATEKILMDAAPAGENGDWMQIDLRLPCEGYVPAARLTKSLAILDKTPVRFLPDASSDIITHARDGDIYEIQSIDDHWAKVRINKQLTTFYQPTAIEPSAPAADSEPIPEPPVLDLPGPAPTHTPAQNALRLTPNTPIGRTALDNLPPENVIWKSAPRSPAPTRGPQPQAAVTQPQPPELPEGIMVGPAETQAREVVTSSMPEPDRPLRTLTGTLAREIEAEGPAYPIRLRSPEGRLIAYVDFSGIFIEDLDPYLNQRVALRGQIAPVQPNSRELVIFAHELEFTE